MVSDSPLTVMIVDDEPFVRKDLSVMLSRYPHVHVAWEAGTLAEAKQILRAYDVGLVFLDIRIRGGSGVDLLPLIDAEKTAVVFVTAYENLLDKTRNFPALGVLKKPVDIRALDRMMDRLRYPPCGD